ncbi:MAG: MBL fold metallo-hydrolase [Oscillospiraceae bacterium]|nr:MBL fold metallo-hydrolase [Oscillospiraceae bacterium]
MRLKISDKITLMLTEQGFTYSNWIYIDDDIKAVIETGLDETALQGVEPEKIDLVINSHHHLDHIRGNGLFSNAEIMIHELETEIIKDEEKALFCNSIDQWDELMPGLDYRMANSEIKLGLTPGCPSPYDCSRTILPIKDGQVLDFGTVKAEVLHTPGHSAGHCCFWFPGEGLLFSSDICLTKAGPWYGEHLADPEQMMRSIDRIIDLKPPRVVSSHIHEIVEDPIPCLQEFKGRIERREERIYSFLLSGPSDIHKLAEAKLIYRFHPSNYVVFWEKLMLLKHLERLERQGRIRLSEGVYYAV